MIHQDPDAVSLLFQRGSEVLTTIDPVVAGAPEPAGPNEVTELADRILTAVGRSEGINECYDSLTGFGNGHPEFMWSSAAVLLLAHGFYRQPPVAGVKVE